VERIGIDLGGTKVHGVVLGDDGTIMEALRVATPAGSYEETVAALVSLVKNLEGSRGDLKIGIGTPGIWQAARGSMKNCNSTWLNGRPLLTDLVDQLGARIRIANDADCFTLSEALAGSGTGCASVFGVILGTGVGGGFVVDGRLLNGPNGLTGEWGHTPLPYLGIPLGIPHGASASSNVDADQRNAILDGLESRLESRECYCQRLDCIETYLSGPGLQRTYTELWGEEKASEAIASADDERAGLVLSLYCRMLARSLAQVINIVDPDVIVLGGGLSNVDRIYAPLNRLLPEYVFSGECVTVVKPPEWGAESGVLGAARLWPAAAASA
jgi:predicted NBD/HSP70 family sugar kinase